MAQIPVINRNAPMETPSVGRVQVQPADVTRAGAAVGNALVGLGEQGAEAYDDAAKTKADAFNNEFEIWNNERLYGENGIVHLKGDVSEHYAKYDEDAKNRMMEMLSGDQDDLTKQYMSSKLRDTYARYKMKSTVTYGKQNADYIQETSDTTAALMKNNLVDTAGMINATGKPDFTLTDNAIERIIRNRKETASRLNIPEDTVNLQIAKDLSDGLEQNIMAQINSGNLAGAQATYDRYNTEAEIKGEDGQVHKVSRNLLDAQTKPKILKALHDGKVNQEALSLANQAAQKPDTEDPLAFISTKASSPEVADKARKNYDDIRLSRKAIYDRDQESIYNKLSNQIQSIQDGQVQGKTPFVSINQMENDPELKPLFDRLASGDKRKALRSLITQPKETNLKDFEKFMDRVRAGELVGMSGAQFNEAVKNFNSIDRNRAANWWKYEQDRAKRRTGIESASSEAARVKRINDLMNTKARLYRLIPEGKTNTWSQEELTRYNEMTAEFIDFKDEFIRPDMPSDQIEKQVNKFLIDFNEKNPNPIKRRFFFSDVQRQAVLPKRPPESLSGQKTRVTPTGPVPQGSSTPNVNKGYKTLNDVPENDYLYYQEIYEKSGGNLDDEAAFLNFINSNPRAPRR